MDVFRREEKGFTLLELLVVIAIIGLLSTFAFVRVQQARENARIAGGLQFGQSIHHAVGANLVGRWSFEDSAADVSGSNLNLTLQNTPVFTGGIIGNAVDIESDDSDYMEIVAPVPSALLITGDLTISVWINMESIVSSGVIVEMGQSITDTTPHNDLYFLAPDLDVATNKAKIRYVHEGANPTANQDKRFNAQLSIDRWYHLVLVRDVSEDSVNLYIDGQRLDDEYIYSASEDPFDGSQGIFRVGRSPFNQNFDGMIDEVALYSEVLPVAKIQQLYAEGRESHPLARY